MNNVYGTAMLCDINIEENKELLDLIAAKDDNLQLEFCMNLCQIVDLFKYYVSINIEHINDLENYDCIYPEIIKQDNEFIFTLNANDNDEYLSDIKFLNKEFKKHFGVSILTCNLIDILRIILMDFNYVIENDILKIKVYYSTYKDNWIKDFFMI